jgi:hypothetical protein
MENEYFAYTGWVYPFFASSVMSALMSLTELIMTRLKLLATIDTLRPPL